MSKHRLILFAFSIFFAIIIVKLFYLQVFSHQFSSNYLQNKKIEPERGKIYDRNLEPLALNQTTYLLYVEPQKIKDFTKTVKNINEVLKIGEATLSSQIDKSKEWVAIRSGIDNSKRKELLNKNIEGIGFEPQLSRFYPEASLSSHLLGFVGKNKDSENVGYVGIEGYYDRDLYGLPGILKTERDLQNLPILIGTQDKTEPQHGRNLILTVDRSVQNIAKKFLTQGIEKYRAKEGCVIIADPYTMEITALTCIPDFDPVQYYHFSESFFKNSSITSVYEPGSTFKPLIMAAAINEKKLKPDDLFDEKGAIELGGYRIQTWDNKYEGKITMTRILEKSSNVGMVYVGQKLGKDNIYRYIKNYGFGQPTGIDLQGEVGSYLKAPNNWYPIDYATATFGQGIAVTPLQMIRAFSSLVNGGELLEPHVVKKIVTDNQEKEVKKRVVRRVITPLTSQIIKKMLVSTVEHGEYRYAVPEGYKIGGKTGTAQVAIKGHYDASKTIASFIGFAPAEKPKFIAIVVLTEPKSSIYGSETAAPLFFDIAKELLVYYNIAPGQ